MTVPPPAPAPLLGNINHHTIELEWGEYLDRLTEVFVRTDGRISVELQSKQRSNQEWELVYAGYGRNTTVADLEPETEYQFRLRFRNKHGTGAFSTVLDVTTTKRPLTGEDIHKAIRMEDIFHLTKVLQLKEANIEAQDDLGFTPLQSAANRGLNSIVELLLQFGANLESESDASKTALMLSAFKNHTEVMGTLIEAGADLEHKDKNGLTALHAAVDGEKMDAVNKLLAKKANPNARDDKLKWTPLHRCAGLKNNGNEKVASLLIQRHSDVNALDRTEQTPLMLAALNGHHKLVELLLEKGADPSLKNAHGHNALSLAEANDRRIVKRVIQDFFARKAMRRESLNCEET